MLRNDHRRKGSQPIHSLLSSIKCRPKFLVQIFSLQAQKSFIIFYRYITTLNRHFQTPKKQKSKLIKRWKNNKPSKHKRRQQSGWGTKQHQKTAQRAYPQPYQCMCAAKGIFYSWNKTSDLSSVKLKGNMQRIHHRVRDSLHIPIYFLWHQMPWKSSNCLHWIMLGQTVDNSEQFIIKKVTAAIMSEGQVVSCLYYDNKYSWALMLAKTEIEKWNPTNLARDILFFLRCVEYVIQTNS